MMQVFGPDLLGPGPNHSLATEKFLAEHAEAVQAMSDVPEENPSIAAEAEQAMSDVPKENPSIAAPQEREAGQPRRVHCVKYFVHEDATPAEGVSAVEGTQEIVRAGDQEFLSGRDAIRQGNTKASKGKPARLPDLPPSCKDPAASALKRKSRRSGKSAGPQVGTSPAVQTSAKAGKQKKQQAGTAKGGRSQEAVGARGTAGHKPRSAASMARATQLLARLLDAMDEDNTDTDPDEVCDSDGDILEAADAPTQDSLSSERMTDEELRQLMDWAAAETPETAKQNSAARVDQQASSSIKDLLGVTTSSSSELQETPRAAAGKEHGDSLQGQMTTVANIADQEPKDLVDTAMDTGTAAEDHEKLIHGVWKLQVSVVPSEEDEDVPADATIKDATSQCSAHHNTVAQENMAVAANAMPATRDLDIAELAAVGEGTDPSPAKSSASAAEEQTSESVEIVKHTAANVADEQAMLCPEGDTSLTAEALERSNQSTVPKQSPEGHTYLTPKVLEKFKTFLEDRSGASSPEVVQPSAATNMQAPSSGSDLTPMSGRTPLFTIPE